MERRRAFGYASVLWRSVVVDAPRPTKMGNIASPWRNDAAASHARAPLKHPIAYDLALRPRAAIFQCHGRLGWALIHPRNRVYVGCRRKPGGQISAFWPSEPHGMLYSSVLSAFLAGVRVCIGRNGLRSTSAPSLNVPKLTEPVSSLRYKSTTRPPERGHEAGAAMQAAGPYALWVFREPEGMGDRKGRGK